MKSSYQFENLENRDVESKFLAERAQLRLEGFTDLLSRHGLKNHGQALEVGCGHGIRTTLLANHFPKVKVIGIDRSAELLAHTKEQEGLHFQKADLYELPFEDETFDFIYARLVFMHLEKPIRALESLQRVLKPGGRILIEDADRDCMFFEPAPPTFAKFWRNVQNGQRHHGGDPNVGRKLAPYMKMIGLTDIQVEAQPIYGAQKEIEFLATTLLPSLNSYLPLEDRKEGAEAIADILEMAKDPRATFYHFWFAVSGRKKT